ncbi:ATP-binding protein [uncultured Flavobacterium sp.]|uniref:ATP-binding protein n=1 Tax=uncultured Flavobacterium sp. TaxID=165435 RepID=UPI0027DECB41|nr:ATP-binding protein [uncultured Flavobacterium sp.]
MKKRFIDPFFPNRPVKDPSLFEGRTEQIDEIVDALYQTKNNNPKHFIITGDRGIGKSSLLLQTKILSEGENSLADRYEIDLGVEKYDFLSSWTDVTEGQTLENLAKSLLVDLESTVKKIFASLKFSIDLGGFVQIEKNANGEKSVTDIVNEFVKSLKTIYENVSKKSKDGIIIFIDELDRVSVSSGVSSFFKLVTEKLNRENINNVIFVASGITGAIQKLGSEHASIDRTFRDIPLPLFTEQETKEILVNGFDKIGFTFDESIPSLSYSISSGFPEPIHILGSEMLSVSTDNHICEEDFKNAKVKIVTDVRKNKLQDILTKAGYGKYQSILEAMAKYSDVNVPLEYISKEIKSKQNEFSSNIGTLIDKNIIRRVDRSVYAFVDPLLKEYIKQFGIIKIDK